MSRIRLLLSILLLASSAAWAEQGDLPYRSDGFYVGLGGGLSALEFNSASYSVDGNDLATKGIFGYRLGKNFTRLGINVGVEAAYLDLGLVNDASSGTNLDLESSGYGASAVAFFPIMHRWDIIAKAGFFVSDSELLTEGVQVAEESSTDLNLGFGTSFNTGSGWGFRGEIENLGMLDGAWAATISGIYQFK